MTQTVTFTGSSFEIQNLNTDPTTNLRISQLGRPKDTVKPRFRFQNSDRSTIQGLEFGYQDGVNQSLFLDVTARRGPSARDSKFTFGDLNDTLIIGASENNTFSMLNGNNLVRLKSDSLGDNISFGRDADQLVFGRSITNTTVNLGNDQVIDKITISNRRASVSGFVVKGANTGDILLVGSTEYTYNAQTDLWADRLGNTYNNVSSS